MQNLKIDSQRLWDSLMEMAKIGATPKGGNARLAGTELDGQGRDLFVKWAKDAGCSITVDQVGNIFARRPGTDPDRLPVMSGSHLDTQPTGGRFDGVYGVLGALEVVRTLNDAGVETAAPIEVAVWTNEEGSRFSPAMMGSGTFAGVFGLDEVLAKTAVDGGVLGEDLTPANCNDINGDGALTVSDAAFMADCQWWNEAHTDPDSTGVHSHCEFPVNDIVNPFDITHFTIAEVNW